MVQAKAKLDELKRAKGFSPPPRTSTAG
jgi:hypothetical protein